MFDHDESFLVSSVVFGADMWTTIGQSVNLYTALFIPYISLHITHIIIITICVYCNFNILLGDIYRIFVNTAMRPTTSFEAL